MHRFVELVLVRVRDRLGLGSVLGLRLGLGLTIGVLVTYYHTIPW